MKWYAVLMVLVMMLLAACGQTGDKPTENPTEMPTGKPQEQVYMNITAEEAKKKMDALDDYILLDVRTQEEYDEKHIPGAILIPDYEIREKAEQMLTDKSKTIFVYCRSGRRSKLASEILLELGYKSILEFGGINDWPYETQ